MQAPIIAIQACTRCGRMTSSCSSSSWRLMASAPGDHFSQSKLSSVSFCAPPSPSPSLSMARFSQRPCQIGSCFPTAVSITQGSRTQCLASQLAICPPAARPRISSRCRSSSCVTHLPLLGNAPLIGTARGNLRRLPPLAGLSHKQLVPSIQLPCPMQCLWQHAVTGLCGPIKSMLPSRRDSLLIRILC